MKAKPLPCQLCGRESSFRSTIKKGENKGKKVCAGCKISNDGNSFSNTTSGKLKPMTDKAKAKHKERSARRGPYFDHHMQRVTHSMENGHPIREPGRVNICHLFDKGRHPSLEAHLENFVYLTWEEHTKFDTYLYTHKFTNIEEEFPNSWETSCIRLAALALQCKERTKFWHLITEYLIDRNFLDKNFEVI